MAGWNASSNILSVMKVFNAVPNKVQDEVAKSIRNIGAIILRSAKENLVPGHGKDTGALQRSGDLEAIRGTGKKFFKLMITFGGPGTGVNYAHIVEFGSPKQHGQFYLLRAVRKHSKQLIPFSAKAYESVWNKEVRISNLRKLM